MGKVLFILISINITAFSVHAKKCAYFFTKTASVELASNEAQKIDWFYDSNPNHGYISQGSHSRWLNKSNRLKPEKMIEIPYGDGGRIVAFHKLRKGAVGQNYAAVAGVGVVNVKLIDAKATRKFDSYLKAKLSIIDFFTKNEFINSPIMYMDHFFSEALNKWVIVSWYSPGVSYKQLSKFLEPNEVKLAKKQYKDFENKIAASVKQSKQPPIKPERLFLILEKYAIYFNNSWSLNFF